MKKEYNSPNIILTTVVTPQLLDVSGPTANGQDDPTIKKSRYRRNRAQWEDDEDNEEF